METDNAVGKDKSLFVRVNDKIAKAWRRTAGRSAKKREAPPDAILDIIRWGYRLFLDREPENDSVVAEKAGRFVDVQSLREEFRSSSPRLSMSSAIPERGLRL